MEVGVGGGERVGGQRDEARDEERDGRGRKVGEGGRDGGGRKGREGGRDGGAREGWK